MIEQFGLLIGLSYQLFTFVAYIFVLVSNIRLFELLYPLDMFKHLSFREYSIDMDKASQSIVRLIYWKTLYCSYVQMFEYNDWNKDSIMQLSFQSVIYVYVFKSGTSLSETNAIASDGNAIYIHFRQAGGINKTPE